MEAYATLGDMAILFRPLTSAEEPKALMLLETASDALRQEALNVGKDLDEMIDSEEVLPNVVKAITVDIASRALLANTTKEPLTQYSQSGLGYVASGSFLNPGGGIFIKRSELSRLGLKRQAIWGVPLC